MEFLAVFVLGLVLGQIFVLGQFLFCSEKINGDRGKSVNCVQQEDAGSFCLFPKILETQQWRVSGHSDVRRSGKRV